MTRLSRTLCELCPHRIAERLIRDQLNSQVPKVLAQCRLAKSLIIGHAILPLAGDVPDLRSVDYRVQEHAGESRGQVIEHVLDEGVMVPNITPPRNNLPGIKDRLAPVS